LDKDDKKEEQFQIIKRKKYERAPKYVGENSILNSIQKIKKRGEGQNMSENIDLVIIRKRMIKKKGGSQIMSEIINHIKTEKNL